MSIIHASKENFEEVVLKNEKKVLLDFYADWCGPCRLVAPILEEIAEEYPEYAVVKVNVDEERELALEYQVMSIPSLFVIEGGKVVNQALGAQTKAQLLTMLQ